MAYHKTLAHRLFNTTKISSSSFKSLIPTNPATTTFSRDFLGATDSGKSGFFRRFLQKRAIIQSPEIRFLPTGDKLIDKLKDLNPNRDRIRFDGLNPSLTRSSDSVEAISVEDARKLLKLSRLEMLKSAIRRIPKSCITYSEFVQICVEGSSSSDEGLKLAKMLDESGIVIVLGNVVYLRPEQVAKAVVGLIPLSIAVPNDPQIKELELMEKEKARIDEKAEKLVRRELWCGLGFLMVQTAGFMRLTFWELSWDVMEPICFYVTSMYFMAGYTFFLRTSRDPSFEGFFESRFSAKQKRLMKMKNFDTDRYNELRRACYPSSFSSSLEQAPSLSFDQSERTLLGSLRHQV